MPGVPSGRGCDACRKQKKKCDQKKPSCARCTRLNIPCVGSGVQRYKFKHEGVVQQRQSAASQSALVAAAKPRPKPPLSNETTAVAGAFISVLEIPDVRYDIYTYGIFFSDLPRRLGQSPVLDASVSALTGAFKSLHVAESKVEALALYGKALNLLRTALQDPSLYRTVDATCAIYIVLICEQWIGNQQDLFAEHGLVLWHLLQDAATHGWAHHFEPMILKTMCATVVLEGLCNPKITFGPWFWELLESSGRPQPYRTNEGATFHSLDLHSMAQISDFIREPERYWFQISCYYALALEEYPRIRKTVDALEAMVDAPQATLEAKKMCTRFQTLFGLVLTVGILLNRILRGIEGAGPHLATEAEALCRETIRLARSASQHRPLAVSYMSAALAVAWMASTDPVQQAEAQVLLMEYETDFVDSRWMWRARWMRRAIDRLLPFKDGTSRLLPAAGEPDDELAMEVLGESCVML